MVYPSIIETIGRNSKAFDLPTKLLQERIIYLSSPINSEIANFLIMQLLWLNADNSEEPINLYINSPGGGIYDTFGIKDIIYSIKSKVNTIGVGLCASAAAYLLFAGTGIRKTTSNTRIMIHSLSTEINHSTIHDIKIDYEESIYLQNKMIDDLVLFSHGKTKKHILNDKCSRNYYIDPTLAISMGLLDSII